MLTFQEIMTSSPFYHAVIMGGWKGKSRGFSKVMDNPVNLNQPSLLLLPNSEHTWIQLTDYLSIQHVQGIILYGDNETMIPPAFHEIIESLQKPLLLLKNYSVYHIKKKIDEFIQLKSQGMYQYVWERSAAYWLEYINENGLEATIARLQVFIDESLIMIDTKMNVYPAKTDDGRCEQIDKWKSLYYEALKSEEELSIMEMENQTFLVFQLKAGDVHYGVIFIEEHPGMTVDICIEQMTFAIPAIISQMKANEAIYLAHQSYKEHFLNNLLYNRIDSEQGIIQQGKQWGWDFSTSTQLMVVELDFPLESNEVKNIHEEIARRIQTVLSVQFLKSIVFPIEGTIVLIIFESAHYSAAQRKEFYFTIGKRILQDFQNHQLDLTCKIGIGRHYPACNELFRSFYEAKVALKVGQTQSKQQAIIHYEDIGLARLLLNIDKKILFRFSEHLLGDLIQLDGEQNDFYMETLDSFYQNNGDINQTAEQLYIHPNTLRKRLKKIESVLHVNFNQYDDLLKIYVAMKIMKFV